MGFVEGCNLADGPLPPRVAAQFTKKIAQAAAFAHKHGVIHRDLKPANVLLEESPESRAQSREQNHVPAISSSSGSRPSTSHHRLRPGEKSGGRHRAHGHGPSPG
ncbi:MAG TPA: hypothetical protein EYH34_04930 [Planctomycetes bacterium]|nr:hypothetical protein [Planctomycetota bacterium]